MDRFDVLTSTGPASHDLAFEADMLDRAASGHCSLLAASWESPVVVLGYAQPPDDVDLEWCRDRGIPVLRRLTGGTGVIHRGDLALSLALPKDHPWAASIVGLYDRFLEALEPALAGLGSAVDRVENPAHATRVRSPICFEDQLADTLIIDGHKAVGCSQTRRKGGVLIHAAVLLGLDAALYSRVFSVEEDRVERRLAPALEGVGWRDVADAAIGRLASGLGAEPIRDERPRPTDEAMNSYVLERWSPVPDGGIR